MRRRILYTMIAMLIAVGALLGVPLSVIAWWWVADNAHQSLDGRLKAIADQLIRGETAGQRPPDLLRSETFRLLLPEDGQLTLTYPEAGERRQAMVGTPIDDAVMSDSIGLGNAGTLKLQIPMEQVRDDQLAAVGIVAMVVAGSVAAGTVVAAVTAGRIADPLIDLADRAAAMARGDFRSRWKTYGISELDRVSTALGDANAEIAVRLEREGEIVGDVSHQLRSRLTAIQLRLDELTLHSDPQVVAEAEAGLDQIERLSSELDEMVAASRDAPAAPQRIDVEDLVTTLVTDFDATFRAEGRELTATFAGHPVALSARPGRLREAVSVLVDNALQHGQGDCRIDVGDLAGDMVRITVTDDGAGVADEIVPDIFRRGFSGGSSGSGVGLSLARALVEADGGRLDLTSRRPATFAIVVPSADGRAPIAPPGDDPGPTTGDALRRDRVPHR
ncbi:ATP-binding protein [Gordonia sinesedis]